MYNLVFLLMSIGAIYCQLLGMKESMFQLNKVDPKSSEMKPVGCLHEGVVPGYTSLIDQKNELYYTVTYIYVDGWDSGERLKVFFLVGLDLRPEGIGEVMWNMSLPGVSKTEPGRFALDYQLTGLDQNSGHVYLTRTMSFGRTLEFGNWSIVRVLPYSSVFEVLMTNDLVGSKPFVTFPRSFNSISRTLYLGVQEYTAYIIGWNVDIIPMEEVFRKLYYFFADGATADGALEYDPVTEKVWCEGLMKNEKIGIYKNQFFTIDLNQTVEPQSIWGSDRYFLQFAYSIGSTKTIDPENRIFYGVGMYMNSPSTSTGTFRDSSGDGTLYWDYYLVSVNLDNGKIISLAECLKGEENEKNTTFACPYNLAYKY